MAKAKDVVKREAKSVEKDIAAASARRPWTVIAWAAGIGAVAVLAAILLVW